MYIRSKVVILVILIILLFSNIAYCSAEDYSSLRSALKKNSILKYINNNNSFMDVMRDVFNIVRVIVSVALLGKILMLYADFREAADDPNRKAEIRNKAKWRFLGFVFLVNFWNIYGFLSNIFR